ncbi:MAG TPA: GNAT family N-acetyltransferase [Bryobacteraceae bacterium]|nr:GNAT family N-acetyltransferase [Bryobacteraceae bacterium]
MDWTTVWLETFGAELSPRILIFEANGRAVGACVLSKSNVGLKLLPIRRLSLNAAGESMLDTTYIEFNDLLCAPGWNDPICLAIASYLEREHWDELALPGFKDGAALKRLRVNFASLDYTEVRHPSYYVDLAAIRESGSSFESVLKSSNRKHLRQNIRYHSELGPLKLEWAEDLDGALATLEQLADMSQARSEAVGRRGIFQSAKFMKFHRTLISRCFGKGSVSLLRLKAGEHTVGLLYNLLQNGKVYFYQCGFRYSEDKRLSPGTVTIAFAIDHYVAQGLNEFDFLSGETPYKRWMSTGSRDLVWGVFRKRNARAAMLQAFRRIRQRFKSSGS